MVFWVFSRVLLFGSGVVYEQKFTALKSAVSVAMQLLRSLKRFKSVPMQLLLCCRWMSNHYVVAMMLLGNKVIVSVAGFLC